jgi:hypothetical protein
MRLATKGIAQLGFGASGGVCPPEHLCEFASVSPARAAVEAATSQSRWDVGRKRGSAVRLGSEKDRALLTTVAKPEKMNDKKFKIFL